jgi:hypothetical protein
MPVPTSYTEDTLKTFMITALSKAATAIGLTVSDMGEAVIQTLVEYGVTDITDATNIAKLRALAKINAWRTALASVSADYNFADAGARYDRSQVSMMIREYLKGALLEALPYDPNYLIEVDRVDQVQDPYEFHEPGTRVDMRSPHT